MRFRSSVLILLSVLVLTTTAWLRWRHRPWLSEGEPAAPPAPAGLAAEPPGPAARTAPPGRPEVEALLGRIFDRAVRIDPASDPPFASGDFNGDETADLAVAVTVPAEEAGRTLAAPLARWIIEDASSDATDDRARIGSRPVSVRSGDRLLAIVHGAGPAAWRDAATSQAYLVKNASGDGLRSRPLAGLPPQIRMKVIRPHVGDVIEVARGRREGVVYWTAAAHVWARLPATREDPKGS
jgi:hypothetical protein